MTENKIPWAEKQDIGWLIDIPKLLFSINLNELCMAEILHQCDAEGNKATPEDLEKPYRAKIENLRRCDKLTCVRAAYHLFFNERGSTRETYPSRWKAAWDYVNYYFNLDLSGDGNTDT